MKKILFILFLVNYSFINAQSTIPNGGFENWSTTSYEELDDYVTEAARIISVVDTATAVRSSDSFSGSYSIRLQTRSNGEDTLFGFFTSGDFENSNGFPYSQRPDSIVGYYKSDVKSGDTALMILRFSSLGNIFNTQVEIFTGSQSTWSRFAFPLNVSMTPDSAFVAFASSNALNEIGIEPGSWLMLDSIHFVGTGITQQPPNNSFENWTTESFEVPDDWTSTNAVTAAAKVYTATKSIDSKVGTYALRLESIEVFDDTVSILTNGVFGNDSILGGVPFTVRMDTLVGYYKYTPNGIDSAAMGLTCSVNQQDIGRYFQIFTSTSTYQEFKIPFNLNLAPDTLRIDIVASVNDRVVGSVLFLDDLRLASITTSLEKQLDQLKDFRLYPNPSIEKLKISFKPLNMPLEIEVIDALGRVFQYERAGAGESNLAIDVSRLNSGSYYLRLKMGGDVIHRAFIKK